MRFCKATAIFTLFINYKNIFCVVLAVTFCSQDVETITSNLGGFPVTQTITSIQCAPVPSTQPDPVSNPSGVGNGGNGGSGGSAEGGSSENANGGDVTGGEVSGSGNSISLVGGSGGNTNSGSVEGGNGGNGGNANANANAVPLPSVFTSTPTSTSVDPAPPVFTQPISSIAEPAQLGNSQSLPPQAGGSMPLINQSFKVTSGSSTSVASSTGSGPRETTPAPMSTFAPGAQGISPVSGADFGNGFTFSYMFILIVFVSGCLVGYCDI